MTPGGKRCLFLVFILRITFPFLNTELPADTDYSKGNIEAPTIRK